MGKSNFTPLWGLNRRTRLVPEGKIILLDRVDSTMDEAKRLLAAGHDDLVGVRADFQTTGRGRKGAVWLAPIGACLLATYVVREAVTPARLAFAAGVAAAEALESVCDVDIGLKWPNDLMIGSLKVGGILIETPGNGTSLVGVGINVNIAAFPIELADIATSVEIETGILTELDDIEQELRTNLFRMVKSSWSDILTEWRARDCSNGLRYQGTTEAGLVTGVAAGIVDDGSLILETSEGHVSVMDGTLIR